MIEVVDAEAARKAVAAGALRCPGCGGSLRRWGHARARTVVTSADVVTVRPDRTRCTRCGTTHVVLAGGLVARRQYSIGVIGSAVAAASAGAGHRRISRRLGIPVDTVRSWLRRARTNAAAARQFATRVVVAINQDLLPQHAARERLGDALAALAAAVLAIRERFPVADVSPWQIINAFTHGQLFKPAASP